MPEHASAGDTREDASARSAARADGAPDYYAVLGVRPAANDDEIRRAYHRLAKLWHPDRYMAAPQALRERADRRMRRLIAAHEVLADPVRRHAYDRRNGHLAAPAPHPEHAHADGGAWSADIRRGARSDAADFARDVRDAQDAAAADGNPNGAGQFFGLICSVLALSMLLFVLTHGDSGFGSLVAIGAVILLGGLAVWLFVEDSLPSRLATSWMEGVPAANTAEDAGYHMPYHKPHRTYRHGGQRARPAHKPSADESASTQTTPQSPDSDDSVPEAEPSGAFERLVADALDHIPSEFQRYMENVVVRVQAEPSAEELASVAVREGGTLLGLYHGVNLTHQRMAGAPAPEEITIYQGPIERYCRGNPTRIREQVRRTVLHELAHHFGIDHEEMPDWVR